MTAREVNTTIKRRQRREMNPFKRQHTGGKGGNDAAPTFWRSSSRRRSGTEGETEAGSPMERDGTFFVRSSELGISIFSSSSGTVKKATSFKNDLPPLLSLSLTEAFAMSVLWAFGPCSVARDKPGTCSARDYCARVDHYRPVCSSSAC
ncbi:hypothetical protein CRG98_011271 [Punica granatum]|uniref:Uncharacterized protein n=1 Tax=Punica granatum TaxID=22663 RepID=A0A2I0KJI7_PUNGR|nr:hypothetical protein CRG98_011271 [Punica granatum]